MGDVHRWAAVRARHDLSRAFNRKHSVDEDTYDLDRVAIAHSGCDTPVFRDKTNLGIGFSVQEMLYYFTQFTVDSGLQALLPLLVRTVTTCLMHGMTTAIVGFGLTITADFRAIRVPMVLGLFALASVIHSLYNILIDTHLAVLALVMPAAMYFAGLALLSGENEEEGADDGA